MYLAGVAWSWLGDWAVGVCSALCAALLASALMLATKGWWVEGAAQVSSSFTGGCTGDAVEAMRGSQ